MTKNLLIALIAAALFLPTAALANPCASGCDQLVGDVDEDGYIGYNDVFVLYGWMFGSNSLSICPELADVNGDENVNISDIIYLSQFIWSGGPEPVSDTLPGDANDDGEVNIADVVTLGQWLWGSMGDVCTANADVAIDVSDVVAITELI